MDTIINVQEVQAELDRAARDAQSGPTDVRAGRFVHDAAARLSGRIDSSVDKGRPAQTCIRIERKRIAPKTGAIRRNRPAATALYGLISSSQGRE